MEKSFKDLFSAHAADYALYRPSYPESLFTYLRSLNAKHGAVWDCGTGNGQAAVLLRRHFDSVYATDPSQSQIDHAVQMQGVQYQVAPAEKVDLADASVDLTCVAQALHWFKHDLFYSEVRRVSRPGAHLAVWSYAVCSVSPEVDAVLAGFYDGTLKGYWEPERKYVDDGYRSLPFPFEEVTPPRFKLEVQWDLAGFLAYLNTWSAVKTATQKLGQNPLFELQSAFARAWGKAEEKKNIRWPLSLRVGRAMD